jgi:hypothetical protein
MIRPFFIHLQDGVGSGLKQSAKTFIRQSVRLLSTVAAPGKREAIGVPSSGC